MSGIRRTLSSLLRLADYELERRRLELSRVLDEIRKLSDQLDDILRQIVAQQEVAGKNVSLQPHLGAFLRRARGRERRLRAAIAESGKQREAIEILLRQDWREKKKYEVLYDRRLKEAAEMLERVENLAADEAAVGRYFRKRYSKLDNTSESRG